MKSPIALGEVISEVGGWSTIYTVKNDPDRCVKVLASHRTYKGDKPDPYLVSKKKYGIDNMLAYEWDNYQKIICHVPDHLKQNIVRIDGLFPTDDGREGLVMERVRRADGSTAPSLDNHTSTLPEEFFHALEKFRREVLHKHSIDHFGVAGRNVLVRDEHTPVLIDFQKNIKIYRSQLILYIPYFTRQKVKRNFQRLYAEHNVPDLTSA